MLREESEWEEEQLGWPAVHWGMRDPLAGRHGNGRRCAPSADRMGSSPPSPGRPGEYALGSRASALPDDNEAHDLSLED